MSSVSHTLSFAHTGGSVPLADSVTVTGEVADEAAFTIGANVTDDEKPIAFDHTDLREIYIKSDVTLTLETNAVDHTGGDIFTITAGVPFVWNYLSGIANPFAHVVTSTFWTNATAGDATVYVRTLVS